MRGVLWPGICDYGGCTQDADLSRLGIPEQKYLWHLISRPGVLALLPRQRVHLPSPLRCLGGFWGTLAGLIYFLLKA